MGSITIVKDVVDEPDGPELLLRRTFPRHQRWDTGRLCLDDDGDNNDELPNSILFPSLVAGSYAFTVLPSDWDLIEVNCGATGLSFSNGGETVTVNLQPGQVVTCIFVNEEDTGTVNPTPQPAHAAA